MARGRGTLIELMCAPGLLSSGRWSLGVHVRRQGRNGSRAPLAVRTMAKPSGARTSELRPRQHGAPRNWFADPPLRRGCHLASCGGRCSELGAILAGALANPQPAEHLGAFRCRWETTAQLGRFASSKTSSATDPVSALERRSGRVAPSRPQICPTENGGDVRHKRWPSTSCHPSDIRLRVPREPRNYGRDARACALRKAASMRPRA